MSDEKPDIPHECPRCGYSQPNDPEMQMSVCPRCYRDHELFGELRELVEQWRERENDPYGMNWDYAADELEELLDDE